MLVLLQVLLLQPVHSFALHPLLPSSGRQALHGFAIPSKFHISSTNETNELQTVLQTAEQGCGVFDLAISQVFYIIGQVGTFVPIDKLIEGGLGESIYLWALLQGIGQMCAVIPAAYSGILFVELERWGWKGFVLGGFALAIWMLTALWSVSTYSGAVYASMSSFTILVNAIFFWAWGKLTVTSGQLVGFVIITAGCVYGAMNNEKFSMETIMKSPMGIVSLGLSFTMWVGFPVCQIVFACDDATNTCVDGSTWTGLTGVFYNLFFAVAITLSNFGIGFPPFEDTRRDVGIIMSSTLLMVSSLSMACAQLVFVFGIGKAVACFGATAGEVMNTIAKACPFVIQQFGLMGYKSPESFDLVGWTMNSVIVAGATVYFYFAEE